MRTLIYPGSFDPFTNGHADIARRAAGLCDRLVIAILLNKGKKPVFSAQKRQQMIELALSVDINYSVVIHEGLLVDLYRSYDAAAVIRGLRSESDFRFEAEIAAANKLLLPQYETVLLPCRTELTFTSSTIVREVASYGGDISSMVPEAIVPLIADHYQQQK